MKKVGVFETVLLWTIATDVLLGVSVCPSRNGTLQKWLVCSRCHLVCGVGSALVTVLDGSPDPPPKEWAILGWERGRPIVKYKEHKPSVEGRWLA